MILEVLVFFVHNHPSIETIPRRITHDRVLYTSSTEETNPQDFTLILKRTFGRYILKNKQLRGRIEGGLTPPPKKNAQGVKSFSFLYVVRFCSLCEWFIVV